MCTHADVGFDNPDPSPLRVRLRSPHSWPAGLEMASFTPQERQWRGKIRPYQEIEYAVRGYPISLPMHGLSAYFFYAGARFKRDGRTVDTFPNVADAVLPVLEGGIDFVANETRLLPG